MRVLPFAVMVCLTACSGSGGPSGGSGGGSSAGAGGAGGSAGGAAVGGPCEMSAECPFGQVCDRPSQQCVACRSTADCGAGLECVLNACVTATPCTSDLQCTSLGKLCDTASKRCVECTSASSCKDGKGCLGNTCVAVTECTTSVDCAASRQVCVDSWRVGSLPVLDNVCADCGGDNDCRLSERCDRGRCSPVCNLAGAICGKVSSGADCGACPGGGTCSGNIACVATTGTVGLQGFHLQARLNGSDLGVLGTAPTEERVAMVDVGNGNVTQIASTNGLLSFPAADAANHYWCRLTNSSNEMLRKPRTGGSEISMGALPSGSCLAVVAVNDRLYFLQRDSSSNPGTPASGVWSMPITGGTATQLRHLADPRLLLRGGGRVFFTSGILAGMEVGFIDETTQQATVIPISSFPSRPRAVIVANETHAIVSMENSEVFRVKLADLSMEKIADALVAPAEWGVFDGNFLWVGSASVLHRVDLTSKTATRVAGGFLAGWLLPSGDLGLLSHDGALVRLPRVPGT